MSKRISKGDAVRLIKETDALEVIFHEIDRADDSAAKQSALSKFISEVQKQIKDQRNVKLFSVKVK